MTSKYKDYARFESVQNNFSLLNRRDLDELSTVYQKEQISLLPYSPLAGGVLSGKYNQSGEVKGRFTSYLNASSIRQRVMADRFMNDRTLASTQKYLKIAADADIHPVTMAIAWSKQFDFVASTIVGATTVEQLDASLAAMDLTLKEEILRACDRVHEEILYPMG